MCSDTIDPRQQAEEKTYAVSFDVFPSQTPFQEFIKESRLYTFAQLFAVYHDEGDYKVVFDEADLVEGVREKTEVIETVRNAVVDETFSNQVIFDHITASLRLSYLDHTKLRFNTYRVEGQDGVYDPEKGKTRIRPKTVFLVNDQTSTIISPTGLHTDNEDLASRTEDGVHHIKTYFSSVMENAYTGVSHKHYVQFLLAAFPGRIQVRQLPAMYTELEQYRREARRLDDEDVDDWKNLAEDLETVIDGLDRDLSNDERELLCRSYYHTRDKTYVEKALTILNDHAEFFVANHATLVMAILDTKRVMNDQQPIYNQREPKRAIEDVEQALLSKISGSHGHY